MSIIPAITHPTFCDPRACTVHRDNTVEHAEIGTAMRLVGSDVEITVRLVQDVDPDPLCGHVGDVLVQMSTHDLGFVNAAGDLIHADAWLTPADARLIGAALTVAADRAQRQQRSADLAGGAR